MNAERGRIATRPVAVATLLVTMLVLSASSAASMTRDLYGTSGADRIQGSARSDLIFGLGGDDVLRAKAGDDRLVGGPGDDLLKGGPGLDTYVCGRGFDVVVSDYPRHPDEHAGSGCEAVIFET